jgi:mono/diheme cytochrome c family protein
MKADTGVKTDSTKMQSAAPKDSASTTVAKTPPKPKKTAPKPAVETAKPASDTGKSAQATQDTGTTQTATQDAPLRDEYHKAPRDTVDQATYDGWKQFNLNCARCHGEDVTGTTIAPHLILSLKPDGPINTKELFVSTVCGGRPEKGMPAWCSLGLGMDKIQEIYSYVKGRSDGKLAPGRPAVRSQG